MNLRKLAKGKDCQIRAYGVCNFDPDTTVLAHVRRAHVAGTGQKPPDIIGVWACGRCHDLIDKRERFGSPVAMPIDTLILEGLCRTLNELVKLNAIEVPK